VQFFKSCEVAGEPNSETHVALVKQEGALGLYRLTPVTGQRHQLRVHMNALGLPIVGDQFYPQVLRGPHEEDDHSQALQLLAKGVSFIDPITGEPRHFVSQQNLSISAD
jgi:tRNA pseudouridine32 synthase/23S rRNA pseudouridine746 synthase